MTARDMGLTGELRMGNCWACVVRRYVITQPVRKVSVQYTKEMRIMKSVRAMFHIISKTEVEVSKRIIVNGGRMERAFLGGI